MHCDTWYWNVQYMQQSKINSEIYIFNFGYLSSGHCIRWVRIWRSMAIFWRSMAIFWSQKGSEGKKLAKHSTRHSPNLQDNEDSSPLAQYAMSIYICKYKRMVTTKASRMKTLKKWSAHSVQINFTHIYCFSTWSPLCSVHILQHFNNI
jgi:hypothetical protein